MPLPLAVSLEGSLPCGVCRYNLRGVSILGVCPECGTAVRATLLAVVDPLADELRPILRPRWVAAGLLAWVGGFCIAALLVAWTDLYRLLYAYAQGGPGPIGAGGSEARLPWSGVTVVLCVLLSGAGAALIARPHGHVPRSHTAAAWFAVALHAVLAVIAWWLCVGGAVGWGGRGVLWIGANGGVTSGFHAGGPVAALWEPSPARTAGRLAAGACGLGIIACMRPVTRVLVGRSLAIRTGRVDRQTLLATGAAIGVFMAGDVLGAVGRWFNPARGPSGAGHESVVEWLVLGAVAVMGLGGVLLGLGLFSSLVDAVRIASAVVRPGPSLRQVLSAERPA